MPSIDQLERLLAVDPTDGFVLYGLAQEWAKRGEHERAVEYYRRAAAADADNAYTHFHLARSLEAMGDEDGARRALKDGLAVAQRTGDTKAASEIAAYLGQLS
ncbi:MAG: tetratricopeptide repeat protein [Phycisphaeraceae bacterium]|nr:tetratricopeptide repeat protein [Phycisphaeraceae bacterium]